MLRRVLAGIFAMLALICALCGIAMAIIGPNATPTLAKNPVEAKETADALLQAVSNGQYDVAESYLLDAPELGADRMAEGMVGRKLWIAHQESLAFTPVGDAFATDQGVGLRYYVRCLDMESITAGLRERAVVLLEQRVAQAKDVSEVYDSQNEYRHDVVTEVLCQALEQTLEQDAAYCGWEFTVEMVFRDGAWYALPEAELIYAISGGLVE